MNILFKVVWRADSVAITMSGVSLLSQDLFLMETDGRRRAEEGHLSGPSTGALEPDRARRQSGQEVELESRVLGCRTVLTDASRGDLRVRQKSHEADA